MRLKEAFNQAQTGQISFFIKNWPRNSIWGSLKIFQFFDHFATTWSQVGQLKTGPIRCFWGRSKIWTQKICFLFESANGVSRLKQREKSCFNIKISQKWFKKRFLPNSWNVRFWRYEHTKLDFSHLRAVGFDQPKCSATAPSYLQGKLNTPNTLAQSKRTFEVSTRLGWGSQIVIFAQFAKSVILRLLAYEAKRSF